MAEEPRYKVGDTITFDDGYTSGTYEVLEVQDEDPHGLDDPKWRYCYWINLDGGDYPVYEAEIKGKAE